ncbi:MAG: class I SAM-dependent methyltransferase [Geminicoccaceae bacterium]
MVQELTSGDNAQFRAYHARVREAPPRPGLIAVLGRFPAPGLAVDIGAGNGRDSLPMLARGWSVVAIDQDRAALADLRERAREQGSDRRLRVRPGPMETVPLPRADLVVSSFALPLCEPGRFAALWRRIRRSLRPGGRFAGQLYGPRDGWSGRAGVCIHDRPAIESLLGGLEVERLDEIEEDSVTPRGTPKHWHFFEIVARRPG